MKLWMVFDPAWSPQWVMIGYSSTLRATLVLLVALILTRLFARSGAAGRAAIWAIALAALLPLAWVRELPLAWRFTELPGWLSVAIVEAGRAMVVQSSPYAKALPWTTVAATTWLAGATVLSLSLLLQLRRVHTALRRARVAPNELSALLDDCTASVRLVRRVRLRVSADAAVPFTVGTWCPVIVLPERALAWSETHLRAVLVHELAHVRRFDSGVGLLSQCACVLWWFHPGVWLGVRAMCRERERACDAMVLSVGLAPADYAEALLLSAPRSPARTSWISAAPATTGSTLAARIRAILSTEPKRASSVHVGAAAVVMLTLACTASAMKLAPGSRALAALLESNDWAHRAYAAESIARIGSPGQMRRLEQHMSDEANGLVRAHARFGEQLRIRASREGR